MQKLKRIKHSYFWLKALVILSVIIVAALLFTKQYLILVELVVCITGGVTLYKVLKHKLENPGKPRKITEQIEQPEVKVKTEINPTEYYNINKIPTNTLIEELSRRGQVK